MAFARGHAAAALLLMSGVLLAAPDARAGAGDVKNGEALYGRCVACHALAYDRTGPRHCGLLGRMAGTVKGFQYSDAMKHSNIIWTPGTLDRFLANPLKMVPGTAMGYAGVTIPKDRRDLIAYLRNANNSAECRALLPGTAPVQR